MKLVPVLIRHCPIEGLLSQLIPIDLTNQDEQTARTILLDKVQRSRRKPAPAPNYPDIPTLARKQPSFPNSTQEHSPTLIIAGDADGLSPSHAVAFFTLLGRGLRDAGWNGEHLIPSQLAILPDGTHYNIVFRADLLLPVLSPFLAK